MTSSVFLFMRPIRHPSPRLAALIVFSWYFCALQLNERTLSLGGVFAPAASLDFSATVVVTALAAGQLHQFIMGILMKSTS